MPLLVLPSIIGRRGSLDLNSQQLLIITLMGRDGRGGRRGWERRRYSGVRERYSGAWAVLGEGQLWEMVLLLLLLLVRLLQPSLLLLQLLLLG